MHWYVNKSISKSQGHKYNLSLFSIRVVPDTSMKISLIYTGLSSYRISGKSGKLGAKMVLELDANSEMGAHVRSKGAIFAIWSV